jgi:succinate--hydroxymethylglutarate CoA-transferase
MHITGDRDPVKVGVAITDLTTGLYTKGAILAALYSREKSGKGQKIDVSLMDCQLASLANVGSSFLISGNEAKRWGNQHSSIVPYQSFKAKDGYIVIGAGNDSQYQKFCIAIDQADLITPQYKTNHDRVSNRIQLISEISKTILLKTVKEWTLGLDSLGIPFGPVNNLQQSFDHPQAKFRGMVTEIEHSTAGVIKMVSPPVKYSLTRPEITTAPPVLGQHTSTVLSNLGYSLKDIEQMCAEGVVRIGQ